MPRNYLLVLTLMFAAALAMAPSARALVGSSTPDMNDGAPSPPLLNYPASSAPAKSAQTKRPARATKRSGAIALSQTAEAPKKLPQMVIVVTATRMATPIGELGVA